MARGRCERCSVLFTLDVKLDETRENGGSEVESVPVGTTRLGVAESADDDLDSFLTHAADHDGVVQRARHARGDLGCLVSVRCVVMDSGDAVSHTVSSFGCGSLRDGTSLLCGSSTIGRIHPCLWFFRFPKVAGTPSLHTSVATRHARPLSNSARQVFSQRQAVRSLTMVSLPMDTV